MQPSITHGRDLVHHYLNLSYIRSFRPLYSQYVSLLEKTFEVMITNGTPDIEESTLFRLNHMSDHLMQDPDFIEWFLPFNKPIGFYAHQQKGMCFLNLWRTENTVIQGEMVCLYGRDAQDVQCYAKMVGAVTNEEERAQWIVVKHPAVNPSNVVPIRSSM